MTSTRTFLTTIIVALALACSSGGDDAPGSCDAGDGCGAPPTPRVLATTPAADAMAVPVLSTVTVTFSDPIDAASLSAATVRLSRVNPRGPDEVPAALAYDDATRTLTIDPLAALDHSKRHTVVIDGVRAATGGAVEAKTFSFRTTLNPQLRTARIVGDAVEYYTAYEWGELGSMRATATYTSAGPDGRWFTSDDGLRNYQDTTLTAEGLDTLSFDAPGDDGLWRTADDHVVRRTVNELDANGEFAGYVSYALPGDDGLWRTADDVISTRSAIVSNAAGDTLRDVFFRGAGPDGAWRTADDDVASYTEYAYDAAGRVARWVQYTNAGTDGLWFTADDLVHSWMEQHYDPAHPERTEVRTDSFTGPGTDAVWFTADDQRTTRTEVAYDSDGQRLVTAVFNGPGADGDWETPGDNGVLVWSRLSYDATGERVGYVQHEGAGPDGKWFTDDDVVFFSSPYETGR